MAIYLVQHGVSLAKDVDPERGLSGEGAQDVDRVAQVAKGYSVPVRKIVHSGKKRALQTAEIFNQVLSIGDVQEMAGLLPMDDVKAFGQQLQAASGVMYVGHLPFMEKLTGYLTTGDANMAVFSFQNGGIVSLDREPEETFWQIKWTLMPNIS